MKQTGQILIVTLIILMLVTVTVTVITATVAKNNRQVLNNIEYEKSYNAAENRLLGAVDTLSDPTFDITTLLATDAQQRLNADSCAQRSDKEYYCVFAESDSQRRTIITVEETNIVEAYDLGKDEYFDVVLFNSESDNGFRKAISLSWIGETAFDISLIYADAQGLLRSANEVYDPHNIYDNGGKNGSGFLQTRLTAVAADNQTISINLAGLDPAKVANSAKLRYLRLKAINRDNGTAITVKPLDDDSLPDQVRRVEAFSYIATDVESAAPVVFTQLPLSPATPTPLEFGLSAHTIRQPLCGNTLREGREECDDGNLNNNDNCTNNCRIPIVPFIASIGGNNNTQGVNIDSVYKEISEKIFQNMRSRDKQVRYYSDCTVRGSNIIFFSNANSNCTSSLVNYVVNNDNINLTVIGDSGNQSGGINGILNTFALQCSNDETGVSGEVTAGSGIIDGPIMSASACRISSKGTLSAIRQTQVKSSNCVARFGDTMGKGALGHEDGWCAIWIIQLNNGSRIYVYTTYGMLDSSFDNPNTRPNAEKLAQRSLQRLK